ncbi:hypothetical protein BDQ17DRAFT_947724 [Cyathus striatus]|nr:hypothetical protein BDQ17DRAFT_947724 [Cyathus striatus]
MSIPHSSLYFNWHNAPKATENPENWNAYWETLISDTTKNRQFIEFALNENIHIDRLHARTINIKFALGNIQHGLADIVKVAPFEHIWTSTFSDSERRKYMLEGFVRLMIAFPESESHRIYCNDLTLDKLGEDQGSLFLKLLKYYIKPEVSSYPHPQWSDEMERDRIKDPNSRRALMWESVQLDRDVYICYFIDGTIESFSGKPLPVPEPMEDVIKMLKQRDPSMGEESTPEDLIQRLFSRVCTFCTKPETPMRPLKWCSKCLAKVQRKVFYCSSECQLKGWPKHKSTCGKM